jgi:hypothetical protein
VKDGPLLRSYLRWNRRGSRSVQGPGVHRLPDGTEPLSGRSIHIAADCSAHVLTPGKGRTADVEPCGPLPGPTDGIAVREERGCRGRIRSDDRHRKEDQPPGGGVGRRRESTPEGVPLSCCVYGKDDRSQRPLASRSAVVPLAYVGPFGRCLKPRARRSSASVGRSKCQQRREYENPKDPKR